VIDLQRYAPGARVEAIIPVTEYLANALLHRHGVSVAILQDNQIRIRYGTLSFSAQIRSIQPDLTAVLTTSWVNRQALRLALNLRADAKRFVRIGSDGSIQILPGQVPVVADYRILWQHISSVEVQSEAGRLLVSISARVKSGISN
jgi:hypothetical protein